MQIRSVGSSWTVRLVRALLAVLLVAVVAAAAQAKPGNGGQGRCNPRKAACSTDVSAPIVTITSPLEGATVDPGQLIVTGGASDESSILGVEVSVDEGPAVAASGTSTWAATLDLSGFTRGTYLVAVQATDEAGNVGDAAIDITIAIDPPVEPSPSEEPTPEPTLEPPAEPPSGGPLGLIEQVLANPVLTEDAVPVGRGRMASDGSRSLLLYQSEFAKQPWAFIRDSSTGEQAHVRLPLDSGSWSLASYVLHGRDLWILAGSGPVAIRHYRFDTFGLPTSAVLVSSRQFGDADSRPGELIRLASGGLVAVWHQQGRLGPQGHRVAFLPPGGSSWQIRSVAYMPTLASRDVVVQHPSDGAVWVFSNADAWGDIGAMRLIEDAGSLVLASTDPHFIDGRFAEFDADPETPALAAVADPRGGEIVLAYQTATRRRFSATVLGSYPAIARIDRVGMRSFRHFPVWVERASDLGLVIRGEETWLGYRPVNEATLRFDEVYVARWAAGSWTTAHLGRLAQAYDPIHYGPSRAEFAVRLADGRIHLYR